MLHLLSTSACIPSTFWKSTNNFLIFYRCILHGLGYMLNFMFLTILYHTSNHVRYREFGGFLLDLNTFLSRSPYSSLSFGLSSLSKMKAFHCILYRNWFVFSKRPCIQSFLLICILGKHPVLFICL